MEGRIRPNIYDKRRGLPTDRKITTILIDKDRENDSSRLKRSKMHDTVTKMHQMSNIAGEVGGGGPVEDEQRSFSLPCLRQVPHFYDTDSFLFSYRISNFQLPTNVEVNFLAQILLLPQM